VDEARKQAYRRIVSGATTRIRALLSVAHDNPQLRWRYETARALADLVHNVASFAAKDFAGFDENWHWATAAAIAKAYPVLASYGDRTRFEDGLAERPWTFAPRSERGRCLRRLSPAARAAAKARGPGRRARAIARRSAAP
jgi:hypothetical protein